MTQTLSDMLLDRRALMIRTERIASAAPTICGIPFSLSCKGLHNSLVRGQKSVSVDQTKYGLQPLKLAQSQGLRGTFANALPQSARSPSPAANLRGHIENELQVSILRGLGWPDQPNGAMHSARQQHNDIQGVVMPLHTFGMCFVVDCINLTIS